MPGLSVEVHGKVFTMGMSKQCRFLGVSRSSHYWWPGNKDAIIANDAKFNLVQAVPDWRTDPPATGYQKLARRLRDQGTEWLGFQMNANQVSKQRESA